MTRNFSSLFLLMLLIAPGVRGAEATGFQKKAAVKAATAIDWTFVLGNKSMADVPANWLGKYDSAQQRYDLFVPPNLPAKQPAGLVIFISPGNEPAGWGQLEKVCKERKLLFAAPYGAGNGVNSRQRVRIVLDVLEDVRRRHRIDPDRTYIGGFSGGGRIAVGIAFALPEYFGGVMPVCASGDLREEAWLRHRVIDRLSVALITGEDDFNRAEIERWRGPLFRDIGVHSKFWVFPGLGHSMPNAKQMQEVVVWMEEDLKRRQEFAKNFPATRANDSADFSRANWSKAMLNEAKGRLKDPQTLHRGLMQLVGCVTRWDGLPAAAEAKKILTEYDAKAERPWELTDANEQRRYLLALARSLDAYASGPLPKQYEKERVDFAKKAVEVWKFIEKDAKGTPAAEAAGKRIAALEKLLEK